MDKSFLIGRTIDGYTILEVLGQGGFATIYLAENPKTKERVVIKMARSHCMDEKHSQSRMAATSHAVLIDKEATDGPAKVKINPWDINELLKEEGEALENITHPSWVKIFGKGVYYGIFYLILEYVNGETFGEKIKKRDSIPLKCLIDVIDALLAAKQDGLDYHGDLKPNNIIIKNDNRIKIIDPSSFGLKKDPYTDIVITTPLYNPFLTRDDINSLGIILYEIATGFLPFPDRFHGKGPQESGIYRGGVNLSGFIIPTYLNPTLPKRVDDIILQALHMEPDGNTMFTSGKGYRSISEMKDDLEKLVSETSLSYLQVPSIDKTEAIMRAFSPYLKKTEQAQWLEKVLKHIINYRFSDMTATLYTSSETEPYTGEAQPSVTKDPRVSEGLSLSYSKREGIPSLLESQTGEARSEDPLEVGDVLFARYEITNIKREGLGVVYTAWDIIEKKPVAIRTILNRMWSSEYVKDSFKKAYDLWISLPKHKNIVSAYSLEEINGRPYLFHEYVDGTDLGQIIKTESLDVRRILDIAIQVCDGMETIFSENKIVHRDIKPGRILISKDGMVKITGFELAFVIDEQENTEKNTIGGTLPYMSPEHFTDPRALDNRSDIYSLGCVLYEMVTGFPPFRPDFSTGARVLSFEKAHLERMPPPPREINPDIPEPLEEIILKCLSKSPEDRFQTSGELRKALCSI